MSKMTFDEWFKSTAYTDRDCAKEAWEAGWWEGLDEGYTVGYNDSGICPECLEEVQHKNDCGRR